jgi:Zn-finger nucleic acid-binding protein
MLLVVAFTSVALADRVHLKDGTTIEVDEAWDDPQGVWYRQGGVSYLVEHARVKSIERATVGDATKNVKAMPGAKIVGASFSPDGAGKPVSSVAAGDEVSGAGIQQPVTIYLKDGASFEVDEANETDEGVWYKRGSLSIFVARERIDRVEREKPEASEVGEGKTAARRERRWTTGSGRLDQLIRQNGARHGVDPYLIFLVMEQESHFNSRAVSPVGARGLMQLMPGTAARFGVRNSHDPAQNVAGGTRFLKQLLGRFNNRVDLVLASYNAGEGNVVKFGYRVPPFRETRNYVRKIGGRYGSSLSLAHAPVIVAEKREAASTEKPLPK